jgi:hypothetical protein
MSKRRCRLDYEHVSHNKLLGVANGSQERNATRDFNKLLSPAEILCTKYACSCQDLTSATD